MIQDTFIATYDDIVPAELCDRVMSKFLDLETFVSGNASVGEEDNRGVSNRRDLSFYYDLDAPNIASEINICLNQALETYLQEYPSLAMHQMYSKTVKVQKTGPKGGFHIWHCEQTNRPDSSTRCLVWMIYLNDLPEGEGTTEFLEQGVTLQPKKGQIVLFPAAWTHTHRGNPPYTEDKYIATGWYYYAD